MNVILCLVLVVTAVIGQAIDSSDVESRYDRHRRAGLTAFLQANYKQSEVDLRDALAEARSFGPPDSKVAIVLADLAVLYTKTGRLSDAEELLQQSMTILQTNDPSHKLSLVL